MVVVMDAAKDAAARVLQKAFRSRKARAMLAALTSKENLERLKAMFMDDRAKKAGAENNPLYAMGALAQRDALRSHPQVVAALGDAWRLVTAAVGFEGEGLSFHGYSLMNRKLYLACYALEGRANFSPQDFLASLEEDWRHDSQNDGCLDEEDFLRSWFELVDVHVEAIDGQAYANWLREITATVVEVMPEDEDHPVKFRKDTELLELIRQTSTASKAKFTSAKKAWMSAFDERDLPTVLVDPPAADPPPPPPPPDPTPTRAPPPSASASRRQLITPKTDRRPTDSERAAPIEYGEVRGWPRLPTAQRSAHRAHSAGPSPLHASETPFKQRDGVARQIRYGTDGIDRTAQDVLIERMNEDAASAQVTSDPATTSVANASLLEKAQLPQPPRHPPPPADKPPPRPLNASQRSLSARAAASQSAEAAAPGSQSARASSQAKPAGRIGRPPRALPPAAPQRFSSVGSQVLVRQRPPRVLAVEEAPGGPPLQPRQHDAAASRQLTAPVWPLHGPTVPRLVNDAPWAGGGVRNVATAAPTCRTHSQAKDAASVAAAIAVRRAAVLTSILGAEGHLSSGRQSAEVSQWARRSLVTASARGRSSKTGDHVRNAVAE